MLVHERRQRILEAVRRRGSVSVTTLADELNVSGMTIRRDLESLASEGKLDKVHGGATLRRSGTPQALDFDLTSDHNLGEKDAIGELAARMVTPGMSVGISAGSTTWSLTRHLTDKQDLTIVTNSLRVADECHRCALDGTVILTGGIRTPSDALVGPVADQALSTLHCDIVFLGVHGVDVRAGLTSANLTEAQTNRALASCGARLVTLADHTKFNKIGLTTIVHLDQVDTLVTDKDAPNEVLDSISDHVNDVRVAS